MECIGERVYDCKRHRGFYNEDKEEEGQCYLALKSVPEKCNLVSSIIIEEDKLEIFINQLKSMVRFSTSGNIQVPISMLNEIKEMLIPKEDD